VRIYYQKENGIPAGTKYFLGRSDAPRMEPYHLQQQQVDSK
jgi:hypothetical protein